MKPIYTATTTRKQCHHERGWYFTVNFWIFNKKMFWCDMCHQALEPKEKYVK